jgi:hypothetical protein
VAAGLNLGESGGNINFQKGTASSGSFKIILKENGSIAQFGVSGETDWNRSDFVYVGRMIKLYDQVNGSEQVKIGTKKGTNELIYETKYIKRGVMIAVFKTPDLTERVVVQELR